MTEDNKVIINPYSKLSDKEKQKVIENETIRLGFKTNNIVPNIEITKEQREFFKGTPYESNEDAIKQTIVARIMTGDPSAKATEDQMAEASMYRRDGSKKSEQGTGDNLLSQAKQQFPYLQDKQFDYVENFTDNKDAGFLEFWQPGDPGSEQFKRPENLNMDKVGIEVRNPETRPIDILGDYVSHYGVENEPRLKELYRQFESSIPQGMLEERYQYEKEKYGEDRPFEQWKEMSGLPGLFRGYTFDQYSKEDIDRIYSPEQIKILDQVKDYLGISKAEPSVDIMDKIAQIESGNRHTDSKGNLIESPAGALGKYQIKPATARDPGFGITPIADLRTATEEEHRRFASDYYQAMLREFKGDEEKALAAYNSGHQTVKNAIKKYGNDWKKHIPQESKDYLQKISML